MSSSFGLPIEIGIDDLDQKQKTGAKLTLLDIREDWELDICRFPDSIDVPMITLPGRLKDLPREGLLVVVCHLGMRSQRATVWLRNHGFGNAVSLRGGMDAWARKIDSSMRTY